MLLKEVAARLFEHRVDHDWHGYSWISRWGDGEGTCDIVINGKTYHLEQGDRDCSSRSLVLTRRLYQLWWRNLYRKHETVHVCDR